MYPFSFEFKIKQLYSEAHEVSFSTHDELGGHELWGNHGLPQWTKVTVSRHSHIQVDVTTLSTHWWKHGGVALAATSETSIVLISKFSQILCSSMKSTNRMALYSASRSPSTFSFTGVSLLPSFPLSLLNFSLSSLRSDPETHCGRRWLLSDNSRVPFSEILF